VRSGREARAAPSSSVTLWRRRVVVGGKAARALPQSFLQRRRPLIFAEQIGERLIGQRLHAAAAVDGQKRERLPNLRRKRDELTARVGVL
jgi:hypothetical protein